MIIGTIATTISVRCIIGVCLRVGITTAITSQILTIRSTITGRATKRTFFDVT